MSSRQQTEGQERLEQREGRVEEVAARQRPRMRMREVGAVAVAERLQQAEAKRK